MKNLNINCKTTNKSKYGKKIKCRRSEKRIDVWGQKEKVDKYYEYFPERSQTVEQRLDALVTFCTFGCKCPCKECRRCVIRNFAKEHYDDMNGYFRNSELRETIHVSSWLNQKICQIIPEGFIQYTDLDGAFDCLDSLDNMLEDYSYQAPSYKKDIFLYSYIKARELVCGQINSMCRFLQGDFVGALLSTEPDTVYFGCDSAKKNFINNIKLTRENRYFNLLTRENSSAYISRCKEYNKMFEDSVEDLEEKCMYDFMQMIKRIESKQLEIDVVNELKLNLSRQPRDLLILTRRVIECKKRSMEELLLNDTYDLSVKRWKRRSVYRNASGSSYFKTESLATNVGLTVAGCGLGALTIYTLIKQLEKTFVKVVDNVDDKATVFMNRVKTAIELSSQSIDKNIIGATTNLMAQIEDTIDKTKEMTQLTYSMVMSKVTTLILTIHQVYTAVSDGRMQDAISVFVIYVTPLSIFGDNIISQTACKFAQYLQTCYRHWSGGIISENEENESQMGFLMTILSLFKSVFNIDLSLVNKHKMFVQKFMNLSNFLKNSSNIIEFFLKVCSNILNYITSWFVPHVQTETIAEAVDEWGNYVTQIVAAGGVVEAMRDPKLFQPITELKLRGEVLLRDANYLQKHSVPGALQMIRIISLKLAELAKLQTEAVKLSYNVKSRPEPPFCVISGPPGQGKSYILPFLVFRLAQRCGLKNFTYPSEGGDLVASNAYTYTAKCEHFDGYRNQPFFLIDDYLPYVDSQVALNFLDVIMRVVNCMAYHPAMAELEAKKTTQINSSFVLATSNARVLVPDKASQTYPSNLMLCPEALRRRMRLRFHMEVRPEWRKYDGTIDKDKVMMENRSNDMTIYSFMKYDDSGDLGEITFEDIVDDLFIAWESSMRSYYTGKSEELNLERMYPNMGQNCELKIAMEIMGDRFKDSMLTYNKNAKAYAALSEMDFKPYEIITGCPDMVTLIKRLYRVYKENCKKNEKIMIESIDQEERTSSLKRIDVDVGRVISTDYVPANFEIFGVPFDLEEIFDFADQHCEGVDHEIRGEVFEGVVYDYIMSILKEKQLNPSMDDIKEALAIALPNLREALDVPLLSKRPGKIVLDPKHSYFISQENIHFLEGVITSLTILGTVYVAGRIIKNTVSNVSNTIRDLRRASNDKFVVWECEAMKRLYGPELEDIAFPIDELANMQLVFFSLFQNGCKKCSSKSVSHLRFCEACGLVEYACVGCLCNKTIEEFSGISSMGSESEGHFMRCQNLQNYVDRTKVKRRARKMERTIRLQAVEVDTDDNQADDLAIKISYNSGRISFKSPYGSAMTCQALGIGGSDFLTAGHVMRHWLDKKEEDDIDNFTAVLVLPYIGEINLKYKDIVFVYDQNSDVVLFRVMSILQPLPSLVKKFIKADRVAEVTPNKVYLPFTEIVKLEVNDGYVYVPSLLRQEGVVKSDKDGWFYEHNEHLDFQDRSVEASLSFDYTMSTKAGFCGSPIIMVDKREQRKIIGMHIAGNGKNVGRGAIMEYEYVVELQKAIQVKIGKKKSIIDVEFSEMDLPIITEGKVKSRDVFSGVIPLSGRLQPHLGIEQPAKSKIKCSVLYGLWPTSKELPNFRNRLHNDLEIGILKEYTSRTEIDLMFSEWGDIKQQVWREFVVLKSPFVGVLPLDVAINGDMHVNELKSIELKTSAGWPYSIMNRGSGFKGKEKFFEGEREKNNLKLIKEVQEHYDVALKQCLKGEIPFLPFTTTLKDEKKTTGKDIRTFKAGNMVLNLLGKQYFGSFIAHLQRNCVKGESNIGINVYSDDWNEMLSYKTRYGKSNIIAGDFKNFDRSLNFTLLMHAFDVVDQWYNYFESPEEYEVNSVIRRTIWIATVRSYSVAGSGIYLAYWGNSSGNWGTGMINNVCQMLLFRALWLSVGRTLDDFPKYVSCCFFGDDHLVFVNPLVQEFNQKVIAIKLGCWGFKYTDAQKQDVIREYETLESCSYLKCGFQLFPDGKYYARRSLDSLQDMVMFVSDYTSLLEATLCNVNDAAQQMCIGYFESEYLLFFKKIQLRLLEEGVAWDIPDYARTRERCYNSGDDILTTNEIPPVVVRRIVKKDRIVCEGIGDELAGYTDISSQNVENNRLIRDLCTVLNETKIAIAHNTTTIVNALNSRSALSQPTNLTPVVEAIRENSTTISRALIPVVTAMRENSTIVVEAISNKNVDLKPITTAIKVSEVAISRAISTDHVNFQPVVDALTVNTRRITDNATLISRSAVSIEGQIRASNSTLNEIKTSIDSYVAALDGKMEASTRKIEANIHELGISLGTIRQESTDNLNVSRQLAVILSTTLGALTTLTEVVSEIKTKVDKIATRPPSSSTFPTSMNAYIHGKIGTLWRPIELSEVEGQMVLKQSHVGPVSAKIFGKKENSWMPLEINEKGLVVHHKEVIISHVYGKTEKGWKPVDLVTSDESNYLKVLIAGLDTIRASIAPVLVTPTGILNTLTYGVRGNLQGDWVNGQEIVPFLVNSQGIGNTIIYGESQLQIPVRIALKNGALQTISSTFVNGNIEEMAVVSVGRDNRHLPIIVSLPVQDMGSNFLQTIVDFVKQYILFSTAHKIKRHIPQISTRKPLKEIFKIEMESVNESSDPLLDNAMQQEQEGLATIQVANVIQNRLPAVGTGIRAPQLPRLTITDYSATPAMYFSLAIRGTESKGSHIVSIRPLELVMQNRPVREKLNRHTLMRYSSIKIRFLIQATAFHYGYLCAFWAPPNVERASNLVTASGQPLWTLLPLKDNNEVVIEIPWFWPEEWMRLEEFNCSKEKDTRPQSSDDYGRYSAVAKGLMRPSTDWSGGAPHYLYPTAGSLHVNVYQSLNIMNFGVTGKTPVLIGVLVNIEGLEVIGNTRYSSLAGVGGSIFDYVTYGLPTDSLDGAKFAWRYYAKQGNYNESGMYGERVRMFRTEMLAAAAINVGSQLLTGKSVSENIQEAAAKVGSHIMSEIEGQVPVIASGVMGVAKELIGFEKPLSVESPTHILPKWANIANTCGISTAHSLGMLATNNLGRPENIEMYRFDGSISQITSKRTLIYMTSILNEASGTNIFKWSVHPNNIPLGHGYSKSVCSTDVKVGSIVKRYNTYLSYMCEFFEYWRGDIVLTIHTNATPMQTGRLRWYWCPVEVSTDDVFPGARGERNEVVNNDDILPAYALNGYIDLRGEKWTEVVIPYMREVPMLQTDFGDSVGRRTNGMFYIDLVESQVSAEAVNPPFWVYIYVHGVDMQFFAPRVTHMSSMPWSEHIACYDGQGKNCTADTGPSNAAPFSGRASWYQLPPSQYKWQYNEMSYLENVGTYTPPKPEGELVASEYLYGESFNNLLDLCKRPGEAFTVSMSKGYGYMYSYFAQAKLYMNHPSDYWGLLYYTGNTREENDMLPAAYTGSTFGGVQPVQFGTYQHHTSRLFVAQRGTVIYRVMRDQAINKCVNTQHSDNHSMTMSFQPVRQLPLCRVDGGVVAIFQKSPIWNLAYSQRAYAAGAIPLGLLKLQRRLGRGLYYRPDNAVGQPVEGASPYYSTQNFWFVPGLVQFYGKTGRDDSKYGATCSRHLQCDEAFPGIHIGANAETSAIVTCEFADNFSLYLMKLPGPTAYWVPDSKNTDPLAFEDMPDYNKGPAGFDTADRGPVALSSYMISSWEVSKTKT